MALDLKKIVREARQTDTIITKPFRRHLLRHGDQPYDDDIAAWVAQQMSTKPRDRSASFAASSATQCPRKQEFDFLGMPQEGVLDDRTLLIFTDGKWRHMRWQADLMQARIIDKPEVPFWWRNMRLRGTADAWGIVPDDHPRNQWRGLQYGFELKGCNPWIYGRAVAGETEIKEEHLGQVARYFLMGDFDLFIIIYENKGTQEWFEWVIEPDPAVLKEQRDELKELNRAIDEKKLSPMLNQCKRGFGIFHECPYGGHGGVCVSTGDWPGLKRMSRRKK